MSTQHPDNARPGPFAESDGVLKGDGEIREALYVFTRLGCDEQMWDYEGKAADVDVVLKLFLSDPDYFHRNVLGKDLYLTLRIPNPAAEVQLRKKVDEALRTVVTSYDLASSFYGTPDPAPPIFEVILPLTTSAEDVLLVESYFRNVVIDGQNHKLSGGRSVRSWLGEHRPESIQMIPLLEDDPRLRAADVLVERYLQLLGRDIPYLRVFLARSDPALNYGFIAATLLAKIAINRLYRLEQKLGIPIYPIIGVGSAPFRGNFRPERVERVMQQYEGAHTFTVQSSFKFDNPVETVRSAIHKVRARERQVPPAFDEARALEIIERTRRRYQRQVTGIAELVNRMAGFIPSRRDRRLHIGLFGYSRDADSNGLNVRLPRAITFSAALYSLGVPPELLGLDALRPEDLDFLRATVPDFEMDLADAFRFANRENVRKLLGRKSAATLERFCRDVDMEHEGFSALIYNRSQNATAARYTRDLVLWAAEMRGFLG